MIAASNDQLRVWQLLSDEVESLGHELETFVGSPLAEGQNAVLGISAPGKIREFRTARENAMSAKVHVIAPVFVIEDLAIAGHQHGYRVREQKHSRGHGPREAIEAFMPNPDILQFHSIHQVMEGDVGIASAQAREQRSHEAGESDDGISSEGAEEQIEPDHVWLEPIDRFQEAEKTAGIVEGPAAHDVEALGLNMPLGQFVGQNGKAEKRIALQFLRDVKPVFTQSPSARGEGCD